MKITGTIEVVNRLNPSWNMSNRKPSHSHLSLGRLKDGNLFLLHQTLNDRIGIKYNVKDNIETLFTKFLNDGKATIRLKQPPIDLAIKCESVKLKNFLKSLKLGLDGKKIMTAPISSKASKILPKPRTKVILTSKPLNFTVQELPGSLEVLQLSFFDFTKFEGKFLRLQKLKILNLSNNRLTNLPANLDLLVNLKEIHVSNNELGQSNDWRWMKSSILQKNITVLSLDMNKISVLTSLVCQFKSLRSLSLRGNELKSLPNGLGLLSNLRSLLLSQNQLNFLPSSFKFLRLDHIDVTGNLFQDCSCVQTPVNCSVCAQKTLVDLASCAVLSLRININEGTLPYTLARYLESANYCSCGKPVLPPVISTLVPINLRTISNTVSFSETIYLPLIVSCCSHNCFRHVTSKNYPCLFVSGID